MSKIGHACHDENGKYSGGKAGDQGGEVVTRTWYNRPWNVVLRWKNAERAELCAVAMEKACANNNIGYDQNQRNSALTRCREFGYDLSKITTACETDCSALVSICAMYAGAKESDLYKDGNSATTSTLKARLKNTGLVEVLTDAKYTAKSGYLKRGDILLYEGHHTAVNLENGANLTRFSGTLPTKTVRKGMKNDDVAKWQSFLKWYFKLGTSFVDGDFGSNTEMYTTRFQEESFVDQTEHDGVAGSKTYAKAKNARI